MLKEGAILLKLSPITALLMAGTIDVVLHIMGAC